MSVGKSKSDRSERSPAISGNNKERVLHLSTLEKALSGSLAINKQNLMTQVLEIMAGAVSSVKQLLSVAHDPESRIKGCLDRVVWQGNELWLEGWASDISKNGKIKEIHIIINGQAQHKKIFFVERPDVAKFIGDERFINSGWICRCELTADPKLVA
ncbi:MAG: hypothetical protein GDA48_08295 [Hormoscilla sp. GM102CHS1]|nr:hypothetical protein [Hormoscilla sp. GM102CHS1]